MEFRRDVGIRLAGEKAVKPDEFITKSQLVPGTNITFDYLDNQDIRINALGGGGITTSEGNRMLVADIDISIIPYKGQGLAHKSIQDNGVYFGTAKYVDIYHNWNLKTKNHFQHSLVDLTNYGLGYNSTHSTSPHSVPKVIGIDVNRVRIWTTDSPLYTETGATQYAVLNQHEAEERWGDNWNIIFRDIINNEKVPNPVTNTDKLGYPRYLIILEEVTW